MCTFVTATCPLHRAIAALTAYSLRRFFEFPSLLRWTCESTAVHSLSLLTVPSSGQLLNQVESKSSPCGGTNDSRVQGVAAWT